MKKLLIFILLLIPFFGFSQELPENFKTVLWDGIIKILSPVNWEYGFVFFALTFVMNKLVKSEVKWTSKFNIFRRIPTEYRTFLLAVILITIFVLLNGFTKKYMYELGYTTAFVMLAYQFILKFIMQKLGLQNEK
jgi:hypothetical protein